MGLFTDSVIRDMTRLADANGAVNLSQGFPDFPAPTEVKGAAIAAIRGDKNQYEVTAGSKELREAIAEKALRVNGIPASGERNVTVTCGATEAMAATVIALTDSNDEIIVPEPFYENYVPSAIISGARVRYVPLMQEGSWSLDEEAMKEAMSRRPKAIVINTPNNPSGRVLSKDELGIVADLCTDYDVLAITDEIYEHIVYDRRKHVSLASLGDMSERTVTISGLSKTYSITGWRLGYTIAEKGLTEAIRTVHDFLTVCAPSPFQAAALEALKLYGSYYEGLIEMYARKRDYMVRSLDEIGFKCVRPQGAYYILADYREVWHGEGSDTGFAHYLVKDRGVAVVPASSFYSGGDRGTDRVRFAYPKKDATLREAIRRLRKKLV